MPRDEKPSPLVQPRELGRVAPRKETDTPQAHKFAAEGVRYHDRGMREYVFTILIETDEDGRYVASCPALRGCYTEGLTESEARENIREAITLHVEELRERGERIPQEVATDTIRIAV